LGQHSQQVKSREEATVFGSKQKQEAAEAHLASEVERLRSLTPAQIAIELIVRVEPGGLDPDAIPVGALAKCLAPDYGRLRGPLVEEFLRLVDEGAQALTHAGLFLCLGWGGGGDGNVYGLSRSGREALDRGSVAEALSGGEAPA
jgi:hypothetical protein